MGDPKLQTAISGSFKFKPEIDALHEEFRDFNVTVLEPSRGWLWLPQFAIANAGYRPLPEEIGMGIKAIEDRFLRAINASDFMYIYNAEDYIGESTAFEIGYTFAKGTPMYAFEKSDFMDLAEGDFARAAALRGRIAIATAAEIVAIETAKRVA